MGTSNILLERSKTSEMTMQLTEARPVRTLTPAVRAVIDNSDPYEAARAELAGYREEMCTLRSLPPRDVFMHLSAWHARANVMRATTYQSESRRAAAFRAHEVDPFLQACDFQFRVWSRFQATEEAEIRLTRGVV